MSSNCIFKDKFEDTKGLIRSRKIDEGETIQWSKEKGGKKTMGHKTLYRNKDWTNRAPLKSGVYPGSPDW